MLTAEQVAATLGLSVRKVYAMAQAGELLESMADSNGHRASYAQHALALEGAAGVPVAHPTDGERDLAALCVRLVRRLREVSPDDKLGATATDYLNQRRYLNPLRIKAMGPAPANGVEGKTNG